MKSVDFMSLWNAVCSVLLCFSVRNRTHPLDKIRLMQVAGEFFLSQSAQSSLSLLAHISSPQKAFGIQRSQSVTANVGTNKGQQVAYILLIGVSRWLRPFPSGEGTGEGPSSFWNPVCSVLLCKSVRNRTHPLDKIRLMQVAGEFFLSQSAQSSLSLLAHISSPQNAFGIQSSQSVTAKEGCWVMVVRCWWLVIEGERPVSRRASCCCQ